MEENKPMFSLPTCEAYNPEGGKPRAVLRGPCPPAHMARPKYVPDPPKDHRMLGMYVKAKPSDQLTVKRCPVCRARWVEPNETKPCTCPSPKK
jgi:hypothetical protein